MGSTRPSGHREVTTTITPASTARRTARGQGAGAVAAAEGLDHQTLDAGVDQGIDEPDVDSKEQADQVDAVLEAGDFECPAQARAAMDDDPIAVDLAEGAAPIGLESFDRAGVHLGHVARGVDPVVEA